MVLRRRKKYLCKLNNSWTEELNFLSRSHVNNAPTVCKVCRTDFNIGYVGENAIFQHIKSQRDIHTVEVQKSSTKHNVNDMYNVTM